MLSTRRWTSIEFRGVDWANRLDGADISPAQHAAEGISPQVPPASSPISVSISSSTQARPQVCRW